MFLKAFNRIFLFTCIVATVAIDPLGMTSVSADGNGFGPEIAGFTDAVTIGEKPGSGNALAAVCEGSHFRRENCTGTPEPCIFKEGGGHEP